MHLLNQQVSEALNTRRPALAAQMVALDFVRHPELEQRYGVAGRDRCLEDAGYHLAYLAQAIAADSVALFVDYVGWAKVTLAKRDIPARDLGGLLGIMKESLQQELPPEFSRLAGHFLDHVLQRLPQLADDVPSFIVEGAPLAPLARAYLQALLRGEREIASQLILDAARQGTAVRDLYLRVFQCTQYEIGRLWQVNEISVAQEHYCTAATQLIMSQLHPYIFGGEKTRGALVATCVSGDLHEIGVRMVSDLFEMDGWHTYYLGANTPVPAVVQALVQRQADALAISATITYHVRGIESLIAAVRRTPDCGRVKILVGGHPFKIDPDLWKIIGADGSAPDAEGAIRLANRLMNEVPPRMKVEPAPPEIVPPAAAREPAPTGRVPTRLDDHLYEELSRINNELANHQRELARTNAEMAATQKKLAISEQRFRNLSACLPIGILELDAAGRCIYTNSHWQTISGLTAEESLGDGWQRALDPRDAPAFLEERTQARQTGREFSREVRFVNTRGDERWAQVRSRAIPAGDGQAASRVSTVEDITERKRAEAALCASESKLRKLWPAVEQNPASVVITDRQGLIEYVNPKFCASSGYSFGEVLGRNPRMLSSGEMPAESYRQLWKTITAGGTWSGEFHNRKKNGELYWESASISPICDGQGNITHFVAVKEDITGRKRTEELLRRSEEKFRGFVENLRDAVMTLDPSTHKFRSANPAAIRMFDAKSEEELLSFSPGTLSPERQPDGSLSVEKARKCTEALDKAPQRFEWVHQRISGAVFFTEVMLTRMEHENQPIVLATIRDITERKQVENTLRKKEHLFSESQRLGHIGSWFGDVTGPMSWSEETYRIYGVSPDSFIPSMESLLGLIHPDDRPAVLDWQARCAAGQKPGELEFRINRPDGALRFIKRNGEAVYDADNRFIHMAGTVQDITERKQALEALRESEERFSGAFLQAPVGVALVAPDGHFLRINRAFCQITGYTEVELLARTFQTSPIPKISPLIWSRCARCWPVKFPRTGWKNATFTNSATKSRSSCMFPCSETSTISRVTLSPRCRTSRNKSGPKNCKERWPWSCNRPKSWKPLEPWRPALHTKSTPPLNTPNTIFASCGNISPRAAKCWTFTSICYGTPKRPEAPRSIW
jgi:PAS domain S-box-containing protein